MRSHVADGQGAVKAALAAFAAAFEAKRRLADEYDAAVERKEVAGHGGARHFNVPNRNVEPTAAGREAFVRVPNALLGRILDGGRASAYAAHLLAIKARHGTGFALQETHVACAYGIGRRGFRQGIARLRDVGAITSTPGADRRPQRWRARRGRPRRPWAAEAMTQILEPGARGWVGLPERLLAEDSFVVALVLTVLLSPRPVRPAEAAARFGVTSRTTVTELVRAAVTTGAVVRTKGAHGATLLGRPAAVAPAARSPNAPRPQLSKNVPSTFVPPYRETAEGTADARTKPLPIPTTRCARRGESRDDHGLIERLRREDLPAHAIELLEWLAAEGLRWWATPDPAGMARQLCGQLAPVSRRAVMAIRHDLAAAQDTRMPPVWLIVREARRAEEHLRQAEHAEAEDEF